MARMQEREISFSPCKVRSSAFLYDFSVYGNANEVYRRVRVYSQAVELVHHLFFVLRYYPSFEGSRCSSFNPTTGINDGMIDIKKENSALRIKITLMPGV
jgi:hypothetical protein